MCAKKRANYTARDGRGLNINYADYSCEIGVLGYHCDGMKDEEGSLSATRHLHARERNTTRAFARARARDEGRAAAANDGDSVFCDAREKFLVVCCGGGAGNYGTPGIPFSKEEIFTL